MEPFTGSEFDDRNGATFALATIAEEYIRPSKSTYFGADLRWSNRHNDLAELFIGFQKAMRLDNLIEQKGPTMTG